MMQVGALTPFAITVLTKKGIRQKVGHT